jgi:TonB family protein
MTRILFAAALLLAAGPSFATPTQESSPRTVSNWDVMLSQYPARAREAREQGPVGFRVMLDREGYASECVVTSSSGFPALDDETCRLIMTRGEFKGINDSNGRRTNAVFEGVLNWRLPAPPAPAAMATAVPAPAPAPSVAPPASASMATASAAPAPAAAGSARLICRRKLKTGSLAAFERTCMTKAEWDRYTANERAFWAEQQGQKGATNERMDSKCDNPWCAR